MQRFLFLESIDLGRVDCGMLIRVRTPFGNADMFLSTLPSIAFFELFFGFSVSQLRLDLLLLPQLSRLL